MVAPTGRIEPKMLESGHCILPRLQDGGGFFSFSSDRISDLSLLLMAADHARALIYSTRLSRQGHLRVTAVCQWRTLSQKKKPQRGTYSAIFSGPTIAPIKPNQ